MFPSDLALELLPLVSVLISIMLSCVMLRIPFRDGGIFCTIALVLSLFCLSPLVLVIVALNTLIHVPFLPELFSFERIVSWNDWYQIVSFEQAGNVGFELSFLLVFTLLSLSVAVYLASTILGWRLPRGARFISSVVLVSSTIFIVSISAFGRV